MKIVKHYKPEDIISVDNLPDELELQRRYFVIGAIAPVGDGMKAVGFIALGRNGRYTVHAINDVTSGNSFKNFDDYTDLKSLIARLVTVFEVHMFKTSKEFIQFIARNQ